jgi:cytoskeletal protein RodZ
MSETIGQDLRQARQGRDLTLDQAAQATHIRLRYLEAMEAGNFDALPSTAQARGFLRLYASYLGLDPQPMLERLAGVSPAPPASLPGSVPTPLFPPPPEPSGPIPVQAPPAAAPPPVLAQIGAELRKRRELLGLALPEIEKQTHLRIHYLKALEAGALEDLPSPVQGRGMLKNYAAFLGLDPEPLLLRFAEALQSQHAARQADRQPTRPARPVQPASPLRRWLSGELLLVAGLVVVLGVFILWGVLQVVETNSAVTATATAPSIADVLLPDVTPTAPPASSPDSPEPTSAAIAAATDLPLSQTATAAAAPPEPAAGQGAIQVFVTARQRAWMRVVVDGEVAFEGRVIPGSAYPFSGDQQIELLTGNGAGLSVFYNQQNLGSLGGSGEVVSRVFTREGVQTPTATITPTASPTPVVTPTPTFMPTPVIPGVSP